MRRTILAAFTTILALAAGAASERCFLTTDWTEDVLIPGQPNVLIWTDGSSNRDVLLDTLDGSEVAFVGAIARNVSQGSVFWVPPINITGGVANQTFEIQLWDMTTGFGCSSPAFRFAEVDVTEDESTTDVPFGPFVTTAISISNTGYVTVTATVATFQSDTPIFEQAVTGSITATDGEGPTSTSMSVPESASTTASDADDEGDSGPNVLAIVIGTIGGVLVVALIVLSVLLWRVRRKRATEKARLESLEEPKEISPLSTPDSQMSEMAIRQGTAVTEVSGDTARHEMVGDSTAPQELPTHSMDPVELPADEIPPPSYPGHESMVSSPTTGDSRRSSLSFDKGTFTVSPVSHRRDQKD
jgi:hypothetical protein